MVSIFQINSRIKYFCFFLQDLKFTDLPDEMIEQTLTFLDFPELKAIGCSCEYLNMKAWDTMKGNTVISNEQFNYSDIENSKKIFENIKIHRFGSENMNDFLGSISKIPCIKLRNIILDNYRSEMLPIIKKYEKDIQSVTMTIDWKDTRRNLEEFERQIPGKEMYLKLDFTSIPEPQSIDLNGMNVTEMWLGDGLLEFTMDIYTVTTLHCNYPKMSLHRFKNLKELNFCTSDDDQFPLLEEVIEINKNTLTKLNIDISDSSGNWKYTLPCQLNELAIDSSKQVSKLLANQRNLTFLIFIECLIPGDISDLLSQNKSLHTIELCRCQYERPTSPIWFLKNVIAT